VLVFAAAAAACGGGAGAPDGAPGTGSDVCKPKACTDPNPGCDYCGNVPGYYNYGHCGGQEVYYCDRFTGQWADEGKCLPEQIVVDSDLRLEQMVTSTAGYCNAVPPTQLLVHAGGSVTVSVDPPLTVDNVSFTWGLDQVIVWFRLHDDWGTSTSVPATIDYHVRLLPNGDMTGTGVATYGGTAPCAIGMEVTGTWDVAWAGTY